MLVPTLHRNNSSNVFTKASQTTTTMMSLYYCALLSSSTDGHSTTGLDKYLDLLEKWVLGLRYSCCSRSSDVFY